MAFFYAKGEQEMQGRITTAIERTYRATHEFLATVLQIPEDAGSMQT
jgi:hypothetical protein